MRIIEIAGQANNSHRNQQGEFQTIPKGWAIIPDEMELPNFPFGTVEVEEIDGVMTVTRWTAGEMPAAEEVKPESSTPELALELAVENQYRLTLLELGVRV